MKGNEWPKKLTRKSLPRSLKCLKKKEVFAGLSYTEREASIEDMYKTNYKPEDIIFKEGDDPTASF